jgi:NitT/TauT family transport system permease protein
VTAASAPSPRRLTAIRRARSKVSGDGRTGGRRGGRWRGVYVTLLAVALVLVLWIVVKAVVPLNGVSIGGTRILPRTDDGSMPWPWSVASVVGQPEVDLPGSLTAGVTILKAMGYSLRLAALGFGVGLLLGTVLGLLMYFVRTAERALMPYILVVPTVPIVVVAPLIAAWSGHIVIFGEQWQSWMTVALVTACLSFWPLAAGLVRGLKSPTTESREIMHCLAASRMDTLRRLSLPSAVPYLLPALRVSAAAAVVSDIVSEISTGTTGGIGALIIQDIPQSSADGSRLYAAVIAAGLLGILAVGLVSALELPLRKYLERGS